MENPNATNLPPESEPTENKTPPTEAKTLNVVFLIWGLVTLVVFVRYSLDLLAHIEGRLRIEPFFATVLCVIAWGFTSVCCFMHLFRCKFSDKARETILLLHAFGLITYTLVRLFAPPTVTLLVHLVY